MSKSQSDEDSTPSPPTSKRAKRKRKGLQAVANSTPSISTPILIPRPQETPSTSGPATASSSAVDDDGWTNIQPRGGSILKAETSSSERAGEPIDEKKTLAEKLLPKLTPTVVDEYVLIILDFDGSGSFTLI